MRRAARALRMTPSAVSQQIRQLEREAGVTLLRRSTRRLALTDAGEAFYEGCAAMVAAARAAQDRLTAHPTLILRLVATDDQLDLMKERIDIAIAIGTTPPATTLVRQHLADC